MIDQLKVGICFAKLFKLRGLLKNIIFLIDPEMLSVVPLLSEIQISKFDSAVASLLSIFHLFSLSPKFIFFISKDTFYFHSRLFSLCLLLPLENPNFSFVIASLDSLSFSLRNSLDPFPWLPISRCKAATTSMWPRRRRRLRPKLRRREPGRLSKRCIRRNRSSSTSYSVLTLTSDPLRNTPKRSGFTRTTKWFTVR